MNKKYLLSSVTAGIALLYANHGTAQCVTTQDCATLGYTETSCPNGNGVKCPFGNKWFCGADSNTICQQEGFTLTCTGSNQTGVGKACNGKYSECTCASGYTWDAAAEACVDLCKDSCGIGCLYYSDNTCSTGLNTSKTLLGVVIYEKSASQNGWIMAVKPIQTGIEWGDNKTTTGITDRAVSASCTNTQKLVAKGSDYEAAITANNYKPTGTPSGKSWCLPSYDLLNNLNNSTNFARVNAGITIAGGTILGKRDHENVWSSSEYDYSLAWTFYADTSGSFGMYTNYKYNYGNYSVRPVLAF